MGVGGRMAGWIEDFWAGELGGGLVHSACETVIFGGALSGWWSKPRTLRAFAFVLPTWTLSEWCRCPLSDVEEHLETSPSVGESVSSIAYLESKS